MLSPIADTIAEHAFVHTQRCLAANRPSILSKRNGRSSPLDVRFIDLARATLLEREQRCNENLFIRREREREMPSSFMRLLFLLGVRRAIIAMRIIDYAVSSRALRTTTIATIFPSDSKNKTREAATASKRSPSSRIASSSCGTTTRGRSLPKSMEFLDA